MSERRGLKAEHERRWGRDVRHSTPRPSLERLIAGTNGPVSWLEANRLSLPSAETPVGVYEVDRVQRLAIVRAPQEPLTVAGPRRIHTGFHILGPFKINFLARGDYYAR